MEFTLSPDSLYQNQYQTSSSIPVTKWEYHMFDSDMWYGNSVTGNWLVLKNTSILAIPD